MKLSVFKRKSIGTSVLICCAAWTGCVQRNFGDHPTTETLATAISPDSTGLDVNDTAFFFPLPAYGNLDRMVSLSSPLSTGKPLVEDSLFNEVIAVATGKGSGIQFVDENRTPLSKASTWKIISIRFDPCTTLQDNLPSASLPSTDAEAKAAQCSAQLRFVAQPVVTFPDADWQSIVGEKERTITKDYSMHLLFELNVAERNAFANQLLNLKKKCGKTTGVPLGVHPCLHEFDTPANQSFSASLFEAIAPYTANLRHVAFMGTNKNKSPWIFFKGDVVNGKYEHSGIPFIFPTDAEKASGKKLPFDGKGTFEMLNLARIGKDDVSRIIPFPAHSKEQLGDLLTAGFLNNLRLLQFHQSSEEDKYQEVKNKVDKALVVLTRLENPKFHNTFSTDCVSCHAANGLYGQMNAFLQKRLPRSKPDLFEKPKNVTAFLSRAFRSGQVDATSHFSYFSGFPSITERALNDISHSTFLINEGILKRPGPWQQSCNVEKLESCLADLDLGKVSGRARMLAARAGPDYRELEQKCFSKKNECKAN